MATPAASATNLPSAEKLVTLTVAERHGQSKECKKAAWQAHKTKCKLNSRISEHGGLQVYEAKLKTLRVFTSKHRPMLCEAGVRALELGINMDNAETEFFLVCVRERRGATKPGLAYVVEQAGAQLYSSLPASVAEEMQSVRREMNKVHLQQGLDGTFFAVLLDMDSGIRNNAPVGFAKDATYTSSMLFRDLLFRHLNGGITV
ncbi:hypothetical protein PHLGIDRAFT_492038 [Phlebiopsis gigantea 11061_1 CR5-6]|uniref:Uncharacterized protein n=1 Tax=Phlebiopsis gigantea (strain 11061_1 CR5-6) TaxID=745531 RepID=A0A0C3PGN2_PHLG1|nr:hypothetical protein PHLGIDRAFT_492038 [Phlebiopsis gigantea 11061_1 CR5-6]